MADAESLRIVVLGSGNLATSLVLAIVSTKHTLCQIYSKTETHAMQLAQMCKCAYTSDLNNLVEADVYISALKDDISSLVWQNVNFKNKLVLHTAGSLPISLLAPYTQHYGIMYPLMTFSKSRIVDFKDIPIFIEASSSEDLEVVKSLSKSLSDIVYEADSESRLKMHLAAVFVNNFTNFMYVEGAKLLAKTNIPFSVLYPLIDETARKIHSIKPLDAQTGPAVRGDEKILEHHSNMLEGDDKKLYGLISSMIFNFKQKN